MSSLWLACILQIWLIEANVRWVQLRVTETEAEITNSMLHSRDGVFSHLHQPNNEDIREGSLLIYYHLDGRTVHSHVLPNPRKIRGDWLENGRLTGSVVESDVGFVSVSLPGAASHITVARAGKHKNENTLHHTLSVPKDKFKVQTNHDGVAGDAVMKAVSTPGPPHLQKNLVFVSGGFTASQQDLFDSVVKRASDFLKGDTGPAEPWSRYFSMVNIYSVFQPSVEPGASFPTDAAGEGGHPTKGAYTTRNNLKRHYGYKVLRLLSCDNGLSQVLAYSNVPASQNLSDVRIGVDPEKTTVVVLVNDDYYGGAGLPRLCFLYTGAKMESVLIHELGHADALLSDEYDYDFNEKRNIGDLPNCFYQSTGVPWAHWVGHGGIGAPVAQCSYSNYYRPTTAGCLMNLQTVTSFCAVCAEAQLRAIYRDMAATSIAPRCPGPTEVMVITNTPGERQYLAANAQFFEARKRGNMDNGNILYTWETANGTVLATQETSLSISGAELGVTPPGVEHVFLLKVVDQSYFAQYLPETDSLRQRMQFTATYRVRVVDSSNSQFSHCTSERLLTVASKNELGNLNQCPPSGVFLPSGQRFYCAVCDVGKDAICNGTYATVPYEKGSSADIVVEKLEGWVLGIGGIIAGAGFLFFIVLWLLFACYMSNSVKEVIPFSPTVKKLRIVFMFLAVCTMLVAMVIIAGAIYCYNELAAFGKIAIICGIAMACVLWFLSFMAFTAAYFRSRVLLGINGVILGLICIGLIVVAVFVLYVGSYIETEDMRGTLQDEWVDRVDSDPHATCAFQRQFKCSGFTNSCHNKMNSQCPRNCETTNAEFVNPCYSVLTNKVNKYFVPAGGICIGIMVLSLIGLLINWILWYHIKQRRNAVMARLNAPVVGGSSELNQLRPVRVMRNLRMQERDDMQKEFPKIDRDKSGVIGKAEFKYFFRRAFRMELTDEEVHRTFLLADTDGDGNLNFHEWLAWVYGKDPEKDKLMNSAALSGYDRREVDSLIDEYRKLDKDRTGHISVDQLRGWYGNLYGQEPQEETLNYALRHVGHDGYSGLTVFQFVTLFATRVVPPHDVTVSDYPDKRDEMLMLTAPQ
eukprot:TRINITY_DN9793_c0_g1_i1.p1 TRINITY_DN9793_c0_g1~~TRINITY_DN9793_c0_g1_i1.p1  ORF type:complete len:1087 (+),score=250.18 TRINITY_DN9793_c0_g1_i1:46-3306(+)